jgi:hypothetical protein
MTGRALALLVCLLLAGCSTGAGGEEGTATLWITRDRGATVLLEAEVPAGKTLMRTLSDHATVETRYGGRYVQAVNGVQGSLTRQRDWFWFVNGYEGGTSASEYRLRDGDVAWWDFRRWQRDAEARVVVGSFPQPFRSGFAGRTRPAVVRYAPGLAARARALAERVGAESIEPVGSATPAEANVLEVHAGPARLTGAFREDGGTAGDPVVFEWAGEPAYERRYRVP